MVKFDRYTFLTKQVEVGRSPAATLGKKPSWVYPYVLFTTPCSASKKLEKVGWRRPRSTLQVALQLPVFKLGQCQTSALSRSWLRPRPPPLAEAII
eukprot:202575-Prymnesium_polylepis.1